MPSADPPVAPLASCLRARTRALDTSTFGGFRAYPKQQKTDLMVATTRELGLAEPIGGALLSQWTAQPSAEECELEAALLAERDARVARATEPDSVLTALAWYRIYLAVLPDRVHWHALTGGHGDADRVQLNNRTFELIAEVMRRYGSIKPGKIGATLSESHISGVVSTLRALRSRTAGFNLLVPSANLILPAMYKDYRREDEPRLVADALGSLRTRREGFRSRHFGLLAACGFDRTTARGRLRWAVMHFAHNTVLRGGEVGVSERSDVFDPARGLTCADVTPVAAELTGTGRLGFMALVFPCKDTDRRHVKRPIPISARPSSDDDSRDAYAALLPYYEQMLLDVPEELRASTPFFRRLGTLEPLCTDDVAAFAGEAWVALGVAAPGDRELAHEFRIGGAIDTRAAKGVEHGREILRQRGRWAKDMGEIYAHVSAQDHFEVSAAVGDVDGRTLQELCAGWVHPATVPARHDGRDRGH